MKLKTLNLIHLSSKCYSSGGYSMTLVNALKSYGESIFFGAALTAPGIAHRRVVSSHCGSKIVSRWQYFSLLEHQARINGFALDRLNIWKCIARANASLNLFSPYKGNIPGGLILGLGMGLSGASPGTISVELGQGFLQSKLVALGLVLGASKIASIAPSLTGGAQKRPEARSIVTQTQVAEVHVHLLWEICLLYVATYSSAILSGKSFAMVPTVVGSRLIGITQVRSLLISRRQLDVTIAYERIGTYLRQVTRKGMKAIPPSSSISTLGVIGGGLSSLSNLKLKRGSSLCKPSWGLLLQFWCL